MPKSTPLRIDGEYDCVVRFTRQFDRMKKAQWAGITPIQALSIIEKLCKKYNISYKNMMIRFYDHHGMGGYKTVNGKMVGYLLLPKIPLPAYEIEPFKYLRVGVVLHEMTHVICFLRGYTATAKNGTVRDVGHKDAKFVEVYDRLLEYYYTEIEPDSATIKLAAARPR